MSLFPIGLTGAAGSGKSTAAVRLVDEWGGHRVPFAAPLKRMLRKFLEDQGTGLGAACRMTDGDLKEIPTEYLGGQTPRRAMQTLGTEWGRSLSATLWIDAWRRAVEGRALKEAVEGKTVLIIADDVRFANEVAAIRAMGGLIVRVLRPGAGLSGEAGAHMSEAGDLDDPDIAIHNDGSLDWLHTQIDAIAANVRARS